MKQNCSFVATDPPRTPALHRGFGAVGTFRPLRSGPDQARHLPEAPVPERACSRLHEAPPCCEPLLYTATCYIRTLEVSLRNNGVASFYLLNALRYVHHYNDSVFQVTKNTYNSNTDLLIDLLSTKIKNHHQQQQQHQKFFLGWDIA